jgi:hypothetical protein
VALTIEPDVIARRTMGFIAIAAFEFGSFQDRALRNSFG